MDSHVLDRIRKHTMAHAWLISGGHIDLQREKILYWSNAILCFDTEKVPCGVCSACQFCQKNGHPDLFFLKPEKPGHSIKVDEIRTIIEVAYRSPQLGHGKVIVIESAESLGLAASHALLKILEEPPSDVYFFLLTDHPSQLLKTIISRCQRYVIPITESLDYEPSLPNILTKDIQAVYVSEETIHAVAARWAKEDSIKMLHAWYFHIASNSEYHDLQGLNFLKKLIEIIRKIRIGIPINMTMAYEALLLDWTALLQEHASC